MSKLKDTKGFTDHFQGILNLSEAQIIEIDQLEFEKYKTYFWNSDSSELMNFGYLRSILKLLSPTQRQVLRTYKNEKILEIEDREAQKFQEIFERETKRLVDLDLSEDQLLRYVKIKQHLQKLIREKMIEAAKSGIIYHQNFSKVIEEEYFKPIFSDEQYLLYLKIIEDEDQKKLEWHRKITKERFEHDYATKITGDQAILIHDIEENAVVRDEEGEFYSDFEQEEHKLEKYRKILDRIQFQKYLKKYERRIVSIKNDLKRTNDQQLIILERKRKVYQYYQENVLPFKVKVRKQLETTLTISQKKILDELRNLYFLKIEEAKSKFLVQHERYNREFVPNEWEDYVLQSKFNIIRPNGFILEGNKLALELMTDELVEKVKLAKTALKEIYINFNKFQVDLYESSGGEYGGWLMKIPNTSASSWLKYLSFLLLEPDLKSNFDRIENIKNGRNDNINQILDS